jgi:hypothetical protein
MPLSARSRYYVCTVATGGRTLGELINKTHLVSSDAFYFSVHYVNHYLVVENNSARVFAQLKSSIDQRHRDDAPRLFEASGSPATTSTAREMSASL